RSSSSAPRCATTGRTRRSSPTTTASATGRTSGRRPSPRSSGSKGDAMTGNGWLQIALYVVALLAVTKPLGVYMARVFAGEKTFLDRPLRPLERLTYRLCRIDPAVEQPWTTYTAAMLVFSLVGMLVLYGIERLQGLLPLNPQKFPAVAPDLA